MKLNQDYLPKVNHVSFQQNNQPENVRLGFLLMGIHDVLMLKGKKTGISAYEELAKKLRQRIYQMLSVEGDYA
jgi:hypothetical protein